MPSNFRDSDEFHFMTTFEGHISPYNEAEDKDGSMTAYNDRANAHTPDNNPLFTDIADNDRGRNRNRKGK